MREFIRESWKTASAFAAGAFLLSILIGLITANPFGVVFLRALLLGIFFAGLGAGLRWAVRTWLAAPAAAAADMSAGGPPESRGSRVDITLGEEERDPAKGAYSVTEAEGMGDSLSEPGDDSAARAQAEALGKISQELGEDSRGAEEEAAGVEEVDGDPSAELPGPRSGMDARGGLDSLPDISLQEAPPPRAASRSRRTRPETPGEALRDAVKDTVARQDPATLARALRTVLKKDDKG